MNLCSKLSSRRYYDGAYMMLLDGRIKPQQAFNEWYQKATSSSVSISL
jgi:hypothetical protein